MKIRDFFLFSQKRYALPMDCVAEVRQCADDSETTAVRSVSDFDLWDNETDPQTRVLYLNSAQGRTALRIRGRLDTVQVESEQLVPLPARFFADSPAIAFIVLEENLALLLDPDRFGASPEFQETHEQTQ